LKYNLERIPRHEVEVCRNSTMDIMYSAQQSINQKNKKKDGKAAIKLEIATGAVAKTSRTRSISGTGESERDSMGSLF
jgi:hypothetical protein